jgi:undecaprenyl-diphosphatase
MTLLQAIVLGLVQAATEFLPVSSSGHLILVPRLLGWPDQGLAFDEAVHVGTLVATLLYFRREVGEMTTGFLASLRRPAETSPAGRLAWLLALGTVPAAVAGLLLDDWVGTVARNPRLIAGTLIGFGLLLGIADRVGRRDRDLATVGLKEALLIGCAQALALVPGTSRSGITITTALFLGFDRGAAARFSFLLSIPVGLLVALHDLLQIARGSLPQAGLLPVGAALLVSAVAAYLVIAGLLAWLRRQSLMPFVVYRVALGLVILAFFGRLLPDR